MSDGRRSVESTHPPSSFALTSRTLQPPRKLIKAGVTITSRTLQPPIRFRPPSDSKAVARVLATDLAAGRPGSQLSSSSSSGVQRQRQEGR
jgi:hypothetical protein